MSRKVKDQAQNLAPKKNTAQVQLQIDTLNINLPVGFEKRSANISRKVSKQLESINLNISEDRYWSSLSVSGVKVSGGETDTRIARQIANAIRTKISSPKTNTARHTQLGLGSKKQNSPVAHSEI